MGGCIDRHNIAMLNLGEDPFNSQAFKRAKKEQTRAKKLRAYKEALKLGGGAAQLWDNWCKYVAGKYPEKYKEGCAFHVSHLHCLAIGVEG